MEDVRRAAEERASRPKTAAVGASFESERQRTKNALVKQLDSLDGRNIRKIAAAADEPEEEKILRVAAYCRVSTDDIDQAISIHLQIQEYKRKILANGKKNKYYQPDHHEAIVSRAMWNAAQRILNSRRYGHEGTYLPMRIIDQGSLSGYISMNRAWAGFDFEDYYRSSQIAMGMLEDELDADLGSEYLPESGRRIGGLVDDHGIAQIARNLTAAEQEIKDELEGRAVEAAETSNKEDAVKSFQVVSGDMFSRMHDPVIRITQKGITFNSSC